MSVYIQSYAVDVPRLEEFVAQTTGCVLQYIVEHSADPNKRLVWWESKDIYWATPGEGVLCTKHGGEKILLDSARSPESFLSRNTREYLREESSFALAFLLQALSRCPSASFIKRITEGHRRWWIGSLLDYTEQNRILSIEDYDHLEVLWQKVLRGYDCGKSLPFRQFDLTSFEFPFLPADDTNLWMSVWIEEEAYFSIEYLRQILEVEPCFKAPPRTVGRTLGLASSMEDNEWNEWVHKMIHQFTIIEDTLDLFERLAVVSFIDS